MSAGRIFSKILSNFVYFDLFGVPFAFSIKRNIKMKSVFGAFLSLIALAIILLFTVQSISSWANLETLQTISSNQNLNIQEMLDKNISYEYKFNRKAFYPYFVPQVIAPNLTTLYAPNLTRHFNFKITYLHSSNSQIENLEIEGCSIEDQDEMLSLDQKLITQDKGKTSQIRLCYKNQSLTMGLYADIPHQRLNKTSIKFLVYPCKNTTSNRNSCAPADEINLFSKKLLIQASIPLTVYDFKNSKSPKRIVYDYQWYRTDPSLFNSYVNEVRAFNLFTDYGVWKEDYRLDSVDFSTDRMTNFMIIRLDTDPLFSYEIAVRPYISSYFRHNMHILDLGGIIGGSGHIVFLIAHLICVFYNQLYMKHYLIKETFSFPEETDDNSNGTNPTKKKKKKPKSKEFKFSLWNALCPSKSIKSIGYLYNQAKANLYEYLELKNLISRLQDIDKLKAVLLNDYQRKLFDSIPKPTALGKAKRLSNHLNLENFKKKLVLKTELKDLLTLIPAENDNLTRKIMNLIDPTISKNNTQKPPDSSPISKSPMNLGTTTDNLVKKTEGFEMELIAAQERDEIAIPKV